MPATKRTHTDQLSKGLAALVELEALCTSAEHWRAICTVIATLRGARAALAARQSDDPGLGWLGTLAALTRLEREAWHDGGQVVVKMDSVRREFDRFPVGSDRQKGPGTALAASEGDDPGVSGDPWLRGYQAGYRTARGSFGGGDAATIGIGDSPNHVDAVCIHCRRRPVWADGYSLCAECTATELGRRKATLTPAILALLVRYEDELNGAMAGEPTAQPQMALDAFITALRGRPER